MAATISAPEASFQALPLKLAYSFLADKGLGNESDIIRRSPERLGSYTTSLRRAKILALLQDRALVEDFIDRCWPFGRSKDGKKRVTFYEKIYAKYRNAVANGDVSDDNQPGDDENAAGTEFAFEDQLRDYLADNLQILEPRLALWPISDGDAVEFHVDERGRSRRIDILAKDQSGSPVVIELKVSRGHEMTIGQALYYRARIKKLFGSAKVRIFIVASEISPELRAAASEIADIVLFEYSLAVSVKVVPNYAP